MLTSRLVLQVEAGTYVSIDPTGTPSVIIGGGLDIAAAADLLQAGDIEFLTDASSEPDETESGVTAYPALRLL